MNPQEVCRIPRLGMLLQISDGCLLEVAELELCCFRITQEGLTDWWKMLVLNREESGGTCLQL